MIDAAAAENQPQKREPEQPKPRYDWADPNIPAGNAPPMPRWPLVTSVVVFAMWIVFLVAMAWIRVRTTSV